MVQYLLVLSYGIAIARHKYYLDRNKETQPDQNQPEID
jgi:hypothetical protein